MDQALREILVAGSSRLGIDLPDLAVERLARYLTLLQTWGGKINLTTRIGSREVVIHHILDSLAGAALLSATPDARLVDLGTGAGLPSIPLKIALPGLRMTLVESVRKKISFCQEVVRATGIEGVTAAWGRAEELGRREEHRAAHDWSVSRALGQSAAVVRLSLPFLKPGGRVLLYKGDPGEEELRRLDAVCAEIGATWESSRVAVPYLEERRTLLVVTTKR